MEKVEQCFGVTVVTSSDNLYADLGFADAEGMHAKAVLACEMMVDIEREGLSEQRAAALLDIPWAEFSLILNGQFQDISRNTIAEYRERVKTLSG